MTKITGTAMRCPRCGSDNVVEVDNLHCIWACDSCGYQGDGSEFDTTFAAPPTPAADAHARQRKGEA